MQPIALIPWQNDFMPALADYLAGREDFGELTVLFPHNRPRAYLKGLLSAHPDVPRPVFMPHMTSIAEFVAALCRDLSPEPRVKANQLDLVELLHGIVTDLSGRKGSLLTRLPEMDRESFLPWGIRLAQLMDDLLRQEVEPQDLKYMESEVSPYAAALLEQLGDIHTAYVERVAARNWTTSGLDWRFAVDHIDAIVDQYSGKRIIGAGFYALGGAEDHFFRTLWEADILLPVIHGDPALANGRKPHWSAAEHTAWLDRWRTRAVIPETVETADREPIIRFIEGHDRHSQLAGMAEAMHRLDSLDRTAVVLPDEGALLPVLHMLPEKEPNISMGYPLDRTSLARLLETLLSLQENRLEDGRYYWRDIINLIRHPYLRLLGPEEKPLRKIFHLWESTIRIGEKYLDPLDWEPPYDDEALADVDQSIAEPLRQELMECCLTAFRSADSLAALGDTLARLANLLHEHGKHLWQTYLIDAECLFRLTTAVIPELKSAEVSHIPFGRSTLYSFLRSLLSQQRVSFEPDPLHGLQVLGVLETRLLHFKKLFILDAVEERLPGTNPYDPLLPDSLRKLLGLPDARERDNVSGYNFYRLLMGADEAVILYQSGIQPGLLDSKSVRSRFVEQLLWEKEKHEKHLLHDDDDTITAVTFPTGSLPSGPQPIQVTEAMRTALKDKLQDRGLSPSRLDQYMHCPKRFYYEYLASVRPMEHVDEDGDRSEFGTLIHSVLSDFLRPYKDTLTDLATLDPNELTTLFDEVFASNHFFTRLPLDTRMALQRTGHHRLTQFLAAQPTATLLGLERRLEAKVSIDGLTIPLSGQVDRIDRRDDGVFILDYKTGNSQLPAKKFWQNMELMDRMQEYEEGSVDPLLLPDLAKGVKSVQLPVYLHLYAEAENETPYDGGLILLGKDGKEQHLFGAKWTDEEREEAVDDQTPLIVKTIMRHMIRTTAFSPQPGPVCTWCDHKGPCGQ